MKNHKIFFTSIVFLLIPLVSAIGITPSEKIIAHNSSDIQVITFNIYNNEATPFNAKIDYEGSLSKHIEIQQDLIYVDKELVPFQIILNMPQDLSEPGFHEIIIKATKYSIETESGQTMISVSPTVSSKLKVRVPYPDEYIESRLLMDEILGGAIFTLPVFNYGSVDLDVDANLEISDTKITDKLSTNKLFLPSGSQGTLEATWHENIGNYDVIANINYNEKIKTLEQNFNIGNPNIKLLKITVPPFNLGEIIRLNLHSTYEWNKESLVISKIYILDKDNNIKAESQSSEDNLKPYQNQIISHFIDTDDLDQGLYDLKIQFNIDQQIQEVIIPVDVTDTQIIGDYIETEEITPIITQPSVIIPIVLGIFIIALIIIMVHLKKKPIKIKYKK